ncbi:hypothetical protein FACS1894170_06530 [Planctomycetales bacterium]|nr:hypothetical protein FACS1894170_06530 [Planctomycetales bacterium]
MKRMTLSLILSLAIAGFVRADITTVVTFGEYASHIGPNHVWTNFIEDDTFPADPEGLGLGTLEDVYDENIYGSGTGVGFAYQSQGTTFHLGSYYDNNYAYSYWNGIGLSTKTDTAYANYSNDAASVTGSGNNNSSTYAVVYGDSFGPDQRVEWDFYKEYYDNEWRIPYLTLPESAILKSFAVANTVYTDYLLNTPGEYGSLPAGQHFTLNISGVANDALRGTVLVNLDELVGWETVDLTSLSGAEKLYFTFSGGDYSQYGINTPTFFAFDDLTYTFASDDTYTIANGDTLYSNNSTPEPATLLIVGLGVAGLALRRRK